MRASLATAAAGLLLLTGQARGQDTTGSAGAAAPEGWQFYLSGYAYFVPDDRDYVSPIFTADRGWLHLEARYNYEYLETGSLFLGWNFSAGERLFLEATPMLGAVFGNSPGFAPAYRFTLGYGRLELYSEGEYLFDADNSAENFFYNWSELSYALADWFRAGLVTQRTRAYETGFEVQRGLLAGFSYRRVDFTVYLFNLGWTSPTVVGALGYTF